MLDAPGACSVRRVLTECHTPGMDGTPLSPGINELGQGSQEIEAVN